MNIKNGLISLFVASALTISLNAQPTFNFNVTTFQQGSSGITQAQFVQAFQDSAQLWSTELFDNVTLNVELQFLDGTFLAGTLPTVSTTTYANAVNLMTGDATSADDALALSSLQAGPAVNMLINRTSQNGGLAATYLDNNGSANNTAVSLTDANAMALGLADPNPTGVDMLIVVGNNPAGFLPWDLDRSDGIGIFSIDMIGVAAHELAHGMGFLSNVDFLDENPGTSEDNVVQTIPDLFRYSADSFAMGPSVFDMSADMREKYFSLDGGATSLGLFSTGANFGDSRQASHWKDDFPSGTLFGLMDPTIDPGQLVSISQLDRRMMDVAGWNLVAVPEPSSFVLIGLIVVGGIAVRRRRTK